MLKKLSKAHLICYVLLRAEKSLTREEILTKVYYTHLGRQARFFRASSNACYFSPTGRANGGQSSVIVKKLVKKNGTKCSLKSPGKRAYTYFLTQKGEALASEAEKIMSENARDTLRWTGDDFTITPI